MTTTRAPLTRERIIARAVEMADDGGIDDVSMRKLGASLGVEAMSLYNHVANKDDIYGGMIDHVFRAIPLPQIGPDWRVSLRETALVTLDQVVAHPWIVGLLMQRGIYGPYSLRFADRALGVLRGAGLSDENAHHAWQMLASHTMGYAIQEVSGGKEELDWEKLARTVPNLSDFPNVEALTPYLSRCEYRSEFAFGLEIIIDGLEARTAN
jgi:AcrR family transcriptional regulator